MIKRELIQVFSTLDAWFDKEGALLNYLPQEGRWSIMNILEHVVLTNHYLLILIDKGSAKSLRRAGECDLQEVLNDYHFYNPLINDIGNPDSFGWERPNHTEPKGSRQKDELQVELRWQLYRCLTHLEKLKNGEGILHKTTMSVNSLGKLDVYQYIYFLALHAKRHVVQMEKNQKEHDAMFMVN